MAIINEDIHSLHDGLLPVNNVIDRFLNRVINPLNCQLSILVIDSGQQRSSGNRISTIIGKISWSDDGRLGQTQMMFQSVHPALPKMLTISL